MKGSESSYPSPVKPGHTMCAGFMAMGGFFWLLLGCGFWFPRLFSAIRQSGRE